MKFQDCFLFDIVNFHNLILRKEIYLTISTSVMGIFDIQESQIFYILNQKGFLVGDVYCLYNTLRIHDCLVEWNKDVSWTYFILFLFGRRIVPKKLKWDLFKKGQNGARFSLLDNILGQRISEKWKKETMEVVKTKKKNYSLTLFHFNFALKWISELCSLELKNNLELVYKHFPLTF